MVNQAVSNAIKQRRAELSLTQQEAARRADVSLATWRRFESTAGDASTLDGFRTDNRQGFARALKLSVASLRRLAAGEPRDGAAGDDSEGLVVVDQQMVDIVRLLNKSFTGDPLAPTDAMALSATVDFSGFSPNQDGKLHLDNSFNYDFAAYLKGEASIRDVDLLCDDKLRSTGVRLPVSNRCKQFPP